MIFSKHISLFVLFLCFSITLLTAQKDDLETGSVEVIRSFDARLLDSEKIELNPQLPAVDTTTKRQTYSVPSKTLNIDYPPPRLRPLAFKTEALQDAYNGYVRAGGGAPNAIMAEVGYSGNLQDNLNLGLFFDHYSANNNNNVENQRLGLTNITGKGNYYSETGLGGNAEIKYTNDVVHWFGYNAERIEGMDDTPVDADQVRQSFNTIAFDANVFNSTRNVGDINYSAGLSLYRLGDESPSRETGFDLELVGEKWFANRHPLQIGLDLDFTNYSISADSSQRLNNYVLSPNFTYVGDAFRVKVGVQAASSDDEFVLFPDVEVGANVIEGVLTIFAGAGGGLHKNNFQNLTDYNPYLLSEVRIRNTEFVKYYLGVQGKYRGISYRVEGGYKTANDLALFLSDNGERIFVETENPRIFRFQPIYDDVDIINFKGTVEATFQGFNFTGIFSQNIYSPVEQEKAWHLPATELNIGAAYNELLQRKLSLKGELFLQNGVPFLNAEGEADNLDALFDLNVLTNYEFNERFGAFFNVYNLLNNKRERWQRYPMFGLNLLVGLSVKL